LLKGGGQEQTDWTATGVGIAKNRLWDDSERVQTKSETSEGSKILLDGGRMVHNTRGGKGLLRSTAQ